MSVRLLELDLARPAAPPAVSARHAWIRVLVRLHGAPVGFLQVRNAGQELSAVELARQACRELAGAVWRELTARGLAAAGEGSNGARELPKITVVVCTRDRPRELESCLAALAAQRYPSYEVLVVDNASRDDTTRELARRFRARCVREDRPGLDWARNRGLAEASSPVVAYTDDDARPDAGWLAALAAGFSSPDVQAVTGLVVPAELETAAQWMFEDLYGGMEKGFRLVVHSRRGRAMTYEPERYGVGCNMAFRRQALEELGGFDPALDVGTATGGGGDLDIFQRLIERDAAIAYRPDAVVRHVHRRTKGRLRRQLFDNGRAYSAVLWASLRRADGTDRLRVVKRYCDWIWSWHLRRIARRALRREKLPAQFLLAELAGALLGPLVYGRARRHARRLARGVPGAAR